MNVCVYCASSKQVDQKYLEAAADLGRALGRAGHTLVYGGGMTGLMGEVACGVHATGGRVISVIPEKLNIPGVAYEHSDEQLLTKHLHDRKAEMAARADVFIALPGGFGTLEELLETITLRILEFHEKPILIFNAYRFFNPLLDLFEHIVRGQFAKPKDQACYEVADTLEDCMKWIKSYNLLSNELG